jgi:hypothetical protein
VATLAVAVVQVDTVKQVHSQSEQVLQLQSAQVVRVAQVQLEPTDLTPYFQALLLLAVALVIARTLV